MENKKRQSISKAVFQNAVISVSSFGIATLIGLLLMPMVVHHLGDRLYGMWVLVGTLLGYFGFLDLGLSRATMRFVSQALGQNDRQQADKWITMSLLSFSLLSFIGILLSIAIWFVSGYFTSTAEDAFVIPTVLLAAGLAFSLTLPSRCFTGILAAHIRQDMIGLVEIIVTLVRAGAIVWIIYAGGMLVSLVQATALMTLLQGVAVVLVARHIHGPINLRYRALQRDEWKVFLGYAIMSFASEVADIIRFKSSPLIIAPFLGLAAVTTYAIAERFCSIITNACVRMLMSLTPAFSQFEGRGGGKYNDDLRRSYFFSYKISCYLGVFSFGMAMVLSGSFIERWMGPSYTDSIPILHIMLVGYFFGIIQSPTTCLLFAVSKQRFYAYSNMFQALLSIGLCLALIIPYKLTGIAIAISTAMFIVKIFIQPIWASLLMEVPLLHYHIKYTLPNVAIPMLYVIGYYCIVKHFLQPDYIRILLVAATGSLLFVPYMFLLGFNSNERRTLLRVIQPSHKTVRNNC